MRAVRPTYGQIQRVTVRQAAMVAAVSDAAVRQWIKRKHLHRDEHGRIDLEELLGYLDNRCGRGIPKTPRHKAYVRRACA